MAILLVATVAQAADEKVNVTGTWNVEVTLDGMQGTPVFTLKQEGEKLTGTYKGQFGDADVTGTVKGADIEFTFLISGDNKVVYKGKVDKDTMKGDVNYADQAKGTWNGKKKKD